MTHDDDIQPMSFRIEVGEPISLLKEPPTPVFVVGMNGSGTSMLADCLGQHPDLFAAYMETKILPYLLLNAHRYGDLNENENFLKLWLAVLDIPVMTQINGWVPLRLPKNWKEFPRNPPSVIDAVFRSIALNNNKHRWAEKTPHYVQHLELLGSSFPRAKFVHIVRDGRDCAASFHRRWRRTPEYSIYRWKRVLAEGRLQSKNLGDRYFELSYEDLTTCPEKWLRQVCNFLDLPFDKSVLRSSQPHKETAQSGNRNSIQPNSKKWKTYFDERQMAALEKIAGATLSNYGYEVMYEKGDRNPASSLILFWKWRDRFREFYEISGRKLTGRTKKIPWSRIFDRALTSIKQSRVNRF
jgi:hypothetical protein